MCGSPRPIGFVECSRRAVCRALLFPLALTAAASTGCGSDEDGDVIRDDAASGADGQVAGSGGVGGGGTGGRGGATAADAAAGAPAMSDARPDTSTTEPPPCPPAPDASVPASGPLAVHRDGIGYRRIVETGGDYARIARDPLSGALFVLHGSGNIDRIDVGPGDTSTRSGAYTAAEIGVPGNAQGMAFGPDGTLYVVSNEGSGTTTRGIIRKGVPAGGTNARNWSALATTEYYPRSNTAFDHSLNGIAISPDGAFAYVNSGSRTDHGEVRDAGGAYPNTREVPLTSAILRVPTSADDLVLRNDEEELDSMGYVFARGTRNSFDPEFSPLGELFAGDNGPDADYAEELNWIREGRHYGFPWRLGVEVNAQSVPSYDPADDYHLERGVGFAAIDGVNSPSYENDPTFPAPPAGTLTNPIVNRGPDADGYRSPDGSVRDSSDDGVAASTFSPHRVPLGLTFDSDRALCGDLYGGLFVLSYGAAAGAFSDDGQDLVHVRLERAGDDYQADVTVLVTGFDRPVDAVLVGNLLYVLEHGGAGTVWEIALPRAP